MNSLSIKNLPVLIICIITICISSNNAFSQQFDAALTKTTVTSAPVKYGTSIPFNITIYNQGIDTIQNVEVIDHFGDGFEFLSGLNPGWTDHPTISNAVTTTYSDVIPPNEFRIVTVNLIAMHGDAVEDWVNVSEILSFTDTGGTPRQNEDPDSVPDTDPNNDAGGLLGSAADNAINGDGTGAPNSGDPLTDEDDHDRDTIQIFDLALTKVLDPITGYSYGDTLIFTTTVYNQGNVPVTAVRVRDYIPEGYINPVAENVVNGWTNSAATPDFTFGDILPFTQVEVELRLILSQNMVNGDAWSNYAEIYSARRIDLSPLSANLDADSQMASNTPEERSIQQGDPDDNNIGNTSINMGDQDDHDPAEPVIFDLALIKERATALASFNYSTPINYDYTIVNQGNISATNIVVVDSLPCGAMFEASLNPDWSYDPNTNIATRTIPGPLDPSDFIQETLVLTVVGCVIDQETAWTNYMEIAQATTVDGIQTEEIDGVFDSNFSNDAGGIPLTDSDNNLNGIGIDDEDNHDVELLQVYDLALKKELMTEGPYTEGQMLQYRIRVYNQGNVVIEDLIIEDFVPEGYGYSLADNTAEGWTNSYQTLVGGTLTTFPDTLNVMEDIFLGTGDSIDIFMNLTLELDGKDISDWYNYAHVWVATDTVGNNRFDDADSNPFMPTDAEFAVIPGSPNDNNILSPGKSVNPQVEEDDHDVANVDFFDVSLTKTATSTPTAYGQDVTFDIVVRNEGVQFAHDITIVDYLPCGMTFSSSIGWTMNATTGNPEYFYTDTLFAGEEVTIPLTLTIGECETIDDDAYRNVAEIENALNDDDVTGDDQDSTPGNELDGEDDMDDALISVFDLSLTKTVSVQPADFMIGTPVSYEIVITNEGNIPAINTEVTDYLPCGLDFSPTGNTGWSQDAITGNISYLAMQAIDPNQSLTIPLTLTIGDCGTEPFDLDNLVEISQDSDPDGPVDDFDSTPDNGDPDEDDIDTAPLAFFDLSLTKTLTTNTTMLTYGMNLNYTIEVTNEGSIPATSFQVTDLIPCGLSFANTGNAGWSLDNAGNAVFDYTSTLNPGESAQLILTLTLEECNNPTSDSWNNVAEISDATDPNGPADDTDSTPDNGDPNEDDQDEALLSVFDLALTKTLFSPPTSFEIGSPVTYEIEVSNEGNVPASNIEITDFVPCGLDFPSALNGGLVPDASGNVIANIAGPIAPGASTSVTLTFTIGSCGTDPLDLTNIAEITSDDGPTGPEDDIDSTPNNGDPNEDDIDSAPIDYFDLSLSKTLVSSTIGLSYGQNLNYEIVVSNDGTIPATSFEITDYLACGLMFNAANNPGWTIDQASGYVSIDINTTLEPGDTETIPLVLTLTECNNPNADSWYNTVEITEATDPNGPADDVDSTPGNMDPNEDDFDDAELDIFDLSLIKTVVSSSTAYDIGDEVIYSIQVINEGNVVASGFQVTDFIPCGMTLAANNPLPWMVNGTGDAELTFANQLQPGSTQSFEIRLLIGTCASETGERINLAEITDNGTGNPTDIDSTPDNGDPSEDDIDDETIDVNVGATIGDYVWNDLDGDGIQDGNESGISGVIVSLYNPQGFVIAETTTDNFGMYEFEDVDEGTYYIDFELDDDFEPTMPFAGNDSNDSNVTGEFTPTSTNAFDVVSGNDDLTIDAGFFICSEIKGVTYYDVNEDDIRQTTENGINGLIVNLYRRINGLWTLWDTETTHHDYDSPSDDGIWDFCVAPGQYYIEIIMPPIGLVLVRPFIGGSNFDSDINGANGPNTTPTFTLTPGGSKTDLGAGYYPMATVGNSVWFDDDHDGIQDDNEAKAQGVLVQVFDTENNLIDETTTDENGNYKVEYLQKKEYYLKFEAPEGFVFTLSNATDNQALDSDVNHAMGFSTTSPRLFNPGENLIDIDAGLVNGALPIVWGDQPNAISRENDNLISWTTLIEVNSSEFVIERKYETEKEFVEIGRVDASGHSTSKKAYTFADKDVENNGKYYYRLMQVDHDGSFLYSNIVFTERYNKAIEISIYPNPTSDELNIMYDLENDRGNAYFQIIDTRGKMVLKRSITSKSSTIDISSFPSGVYRLRIVNSSGLYREELISKI